MPDKQNDIDPEEFLAALLKISPEDAAKAREKAAETMEQEDRQRVKDADAGTNS